MVECDRCHRKFADYSALKQHYGDQHPNAKWPDAFETHLTEEKSLRAHLASVRPTHKSHTKLIIAVALIAIVAGAGWFYVPTLFQTPPNPACANFPFPPTGDQDLAEHYHAILMIYINGEQVLIPKNVGEGESGPCIQPLHVHSTSPDTSAIHIETPQKRTYTVGDFFRVWAATPDLSGPSPVVFNQNQIFNYTTSSSYELQMFVNGQQSTAYDSVILQSRMIIVIVYGSSATDWAHYQSLSAEPWPYPEY